MTGEADELALIERAARGDHAAFRWLVLAYEAKLLAYLTQMLGDVESAQDVAQETFIAAYHALPRWQPSHLYSSSPLTHDAAEEENEAPAFQPDLASEHPLAPWLYRIATNRALSLLRKQAVRTQVQPVRQGPRYRQTTAQAEPWAYDELTLEERFAARELLREALSHLSETDAACLVLHVVSGEHYGEIAARLGLSAEAVRKRVARALNVLREVYAALEMEK